jgi:hypothetical protein
VKALTTAIYSKAASSDFMSYIGSRLFKSRVPTGTEYPNAAYMVITDVPERTFSERYENYELQFSLFSTKSSSTEVETMYNYLKALYDECALSITGSTLVWMRLLSTTGAQVEDWVTPDGTEEIWAIHASFEIYTSLD